MSTPTNQAEATRLAVLHRTGDVWRGLLVEERHLDRPRIVDAREFPDGSAESIDSWMSENNVGEVLCVLPASSTVCRTCALPDAAPEALEQALQLQAEAHLTEIAPPHRLGMAVLPGTAGDARRSGVILAWPETAPFDTPSVGAPVGFAPDIGALAALLNGQRPTEPLMWVDHTNGSLAIALAHDQGAVLRAIREDAGDRVTWSRIVSRALAETAMSVGMHAPVVDAMTRDASRKVESLNGQEAALFLSSDVIQSAAERVEDVTRSSNWWSKYGVAVGAALARNGELAGLTRLRQAPPDVAANPLTAVVDVLSRPRTALWATVSCVLILMFAPLVISMLRTWSISLRYPDLDARVAAVERVEKQKIMYNELGERAWPMTKLLADITANTPVGIELESIRIRHNESFAVSGQARPEAGQSATDLVAQMQADLLGTGIFTEIALNWGDPDSYKNFKFDLSGHVQHPARRFRPDIEHDFAEWTLEARVNGDPPPGGDGEAPAETAVAEPDGDTPTQLGDTEPMVVSADEAEGPSNGREREGTRSTFDDTGAENRSDTGHRGPGTLAPSQELPQFLSADEILALDKPDLIEQLTAVASARKNYRGDDETTAKIEEQWRMLRARLIDYKQ